MGIDFEGKSGLQSDMCVLIFFIMNIVSSSVLGFVAMQINSHKSPANTYVSF